MRQRLAYFHHIPFPCPDVFEVLPWRTEILRSLLDFDLLGFQTVRDRCNFIACLEHCMPEMRIHQIGQELQIRGEGRRTLAGVYPISIDYDAFANPAVDSIAETPGFRTIIGVDRLDYTKGIPERLAAFERLLERRPEFRGRVGLIQIVVPSRENIPEYRELRLRIETLISKINGEYSRPGWIPIHYFHQTFSRNELIRFYRSADIAAVTPLRDGMNLVAKEFCASRTDGRGVLVLSEFAGAASELKCGALLVNPNDCEALALAFETALTMEDSEQFRRMRAMQGHLRNHDVFRWADSFIRATQLRNVPQTPTTAVFSSARSGSIMESDCSRALGARE
jgi:trehalose 6-phosphate synthase